MSQIINPERRDPGYLKNKADVGLSRADNYSLSEIQDIVHGALREEYASGEIYRVDELLAGKSIEIPLIQFVSNGDSKASIFIGFVDSNYNVLYYCKAHIRHSNKTTTSYPDGDSKFNVSFELSPTRLSQDSISLRYYNTSTDFPVVSLYLKEELRKDSIIGVLINQIPELVVENKSYKNSVKFLNPEENIETFINGDPDLTVFVFKSERTVSSEAKSLSIYKKNGEQYEQYFPTINERLDLGSLDFPTINNIPFTGDKDSRYSNSIDGNYNTRNITIAAKHTLKDESVGLDKAGAHKWEVLTEIPEVSYSGTSASTTKTKAAWESSSNTGLCRLVGLPGKSDDVDDFWASVRSLQDLVNVDKERDENVVSYGFLKEYTNRLVRVFGILINNSGVAIKTVLLYEYDPDLGEVNKETYTGKTPISELNYLPNKEGIIDYVLVYPCAETTTLLVENLDQFISIKKSSDDEFKDEFSFSSHDEESKHSYIHFQIKSVEDFHWVNGQPAIGTLKISSIDEELDTISVIFPKLSNNCIFKKNSLGGVATGIAFSKNIIYQLNETTYSSFDWDWTSKTKTAEDNLFIKQESSYTNPIINIYLPHPEDFDYYNGIKLWGYTFLPSISKDGESITTTLGDENIKFTNFEQPKINTTFEEINNSNEVYQFPVTFERIDPKVNTWNEKELLETKTFYNADNKPLLELNSYYREPLPKFKFKDNFRLRTTWEKKGSEWRIYLDNNSFLENKGETNPTDKFSVTYSIEGGSDSQTSPIFNKLTASFDDSGEVCYTDENSNKVSILEGSGDITVNHKLYCEVNDPLWGDSYSYPLLLKNKKIAFDFSEGSIYDPVGNLKLELGNDPGAGGVFYYWNSLRREEDKEYASVIIDNTNRRIFLYVYTCMEDKSIQNTEIKDPNNNNLTTGGKMPVEWVSGKASLSGSLSLLCKADTSGTVGYWVQVGGLINNANAAIDRVSSGTYNGTQEVLLTANGNTFSKPTKRVRELFASAVGSSVASSIYGYCMSPIKFELYTSSDQKNPIYYDWDNNSFTYEIYLGYGKKEYNKSTIVTNTPGFTGVSGELELKK